MKLNFLGIKPACTDSVKGFFLRRGTVAWSRARSLAGIPCDSRATAELLLTGSRVPPTIRQMTDSVSAPLLRRSILDAGDSTTGEVHVQLDQRGRSPESAARGGASGCPVPGHRRTLLQVPQFHSRMSVFPRHLAGDQFAVRPGGATLASATGSTRLKAGIG